MRIKIDNYKALGKICVSFENNYIYVPLLLFLHGKFKKY